MTDLRAAYDPAGFRAVAHAVVELMADALARAQAGTVPVLPWTAPAEAVAAWPAAFGGGADLAALLERVLERSHHLHHPRYVGHQVSAPLPAAALCDFVSAYLNNGMAVFEMGPAATAIERAVVSWMAGKAGLPGGSAGVLTSGGSAGNLTALLAAREAMGAADATLLVPETAHYSIARAAKILGLSPGGVTPVGCDAAYRVRPEALPAAFAAARAAGRRPIAVVASAGSTATGAYDPIGPVADFAQRHQLWLHVDGAHGASALLSARHRDALAGIERADSLVWDAHKMMLMPSLVTAVLFSDPRRSYQAFAQEASYLFHAEDKDPWWDVGLRTLECTKLMMGLKVYACLSVYGEGFFADYVEHCFALAQRFAALLQAAPDFELALPPEANIVCFRHLAPGLEGAALDAHQAALRERLLRSGGFYLVQTRLGGGVYLRTTLINPLTSEADLAGLLDALRA